MYMMRCHLLPQRTISTEGSADEGGGGKATFEREGGGLGSSFFLEDLKDVVVDYHQQGHDEGGYDACAHGW